MPRAHSLEPLATTVRQIARDLIALTKPRITSMVVFTALGGYWLATRYHGVERNLSVLGPLLGGTALVVAGANALNMFLERDTDALMTRTASRPLPQGRLPAEVALALGLVCSAVSVPWLTFAVAPLTGLLAAVALISYVVIYTPMKRRSPSALLVGAVPGAIPPLLGWSAARGVLDVPGVLLFLVMFLLFGGAVAGELALGALRVGWRRLLLRGARTWDPLLRPRALGSPRRRRRSLGEGTVLRVDGLSDGALHGPHPGQRCLGERMKVVVKRLVGQVLLTLGLTACASGEPASKGGERTAADSTQGIVVRVSAQPFDLPIPDFRMVDQKGREVTRASLEGKVWVADFIFTTCPTICPALTTKMASLASRTKADPTLRFVSISVDPENDTPAVLDAFAARYDVDPARWLFLTGEPKHVEETVLKGFKMALQKQDATVVFHAERFVVIDKRGHMRGVFDTTADDLDRLLAKVRELESE
jgi:cytochrome oxidase Cu insertion factor (SCO1/SenC/PrrC family)